MNHSCQMCISVKVYVCVCVCVRVCVCVALCGSVLQCIVVRCSVLRPSLAALRIQVESYTYVHVYVPKPRTLYPREWLFYFYQKTLWIRLSRSWHLQPCVIARCGRQSIFFLKKTSQGRMAETPRAGTGDFECRSWRYLWSFVLMRQGNFFMGNTFLIRSLPPPDNRG